METAPTRSGLSRRQWIALLLVVAVLGLVLAAFNLGLYEAWILKPREEAERRKEAARSAEFAETQKISAFESRLREELDGEDEETVVARLGQPEEKRNVEYLSDGKIHPLWRYKYPPVSVSFRDGRVESVRVESLKDFPRELLDSPPSSTEQIRTERNLYPLKLGNKWEYTFREQSEPVTKVEVATEVIASEAKDSRITATLVATAPGEKAKEEKVMSDERGVYRNGVSGLNSDRDFPIVKYPVQSGDTWNEKVRVKNVEIEMTFVVGGAVEVTVPAGKFKAILVTTSGKINGTEMRSKKWFAEGVGIVKETLRLGDRAFTRELKKFTPGK
jgi:hypothetical protein